MQMMHRQVISVLWLALAAGTAPAQTTFTDSGADAASIQATVDAFRAALGDPNNGTALGSQLVGRREINWDAVPDADAAAGRFPADFFNSISTRGAIFSDTTGRGAFQVSADATNPATTAVEFGHINAGYGAAFSTFSAERLFANLTSPVYDVHFFIPGSLTPAAVSGFGAVFIDVDVDGSSSIEYFRGKESLGTFAVQSFPGDAGQSFLGVQFEGNIVTSVRITSGALALGPDDVTQTSTNGDVVVVDDFIYGEPNLVVPTIESLAGTLQALLDTVAALPASAKLAKKLNKPLEQAVADAQKALTKQQNGQDSKAIKKLKSAAVHLRGFEQVLDGGNAVNELESATRQELAACAAAAGADLAALLLP